MGSTLNRRRPLLFFVASLAFVASGCDRGHIDSVSAAELADGTYQVRVAGWAASPTGAPTEVTLVYVDTLGTITKSIGSTTVSRPDVVAASQASHETSGFDATLALDHSPVCGKVSVVTKSGESASILVDELHARVGTVTRADGSVVAASCLRDLP